MLKNKLTTVTFAMAHIIMKYFVENATSSPNVRNGRAVHFRDAV